MTPGHSRRTIQPHRDAKLSVYEVVLVTADKKGVELRLSPDGKILEDTGAKKPEEKK
jgi:hypothetical protein